MTLQSLRLIVFPVPDIKSRKETIELWNSRARERRHLAPLDDDMLKDIGVSRAEAEIESRKPFWKP
ncbi:MAG: DUF1127 domain-containing protein [Gammaproteobacteria bacterium]|nr:DUF1127 domain-containing protein [Gammaproteobacteria bacterium]